MELSFIWWMMVVTTAAVAEYEHERPVTIPKKEFRLKK